MTHEPITSETTHEAVTRTPRTPLGLYALALASFAVGLAEFVIAGLLPDVATDLSVSAGNAGILVTTYAVGIIVGALALTTTLSRVPPKSALIRISVIFVIGNLLSALGPNFEIVLAGRIIAGITNGAFLGMGLVVAVSLVDTRRHGRAIATMLGGLTLANVLGVPLGTALGQHFGWRAVFGIIAALAVVATLAIVAVVPHVASAPTSSLADLRHLLNRQALLAMGIATFGFGGMFGAFTYVALTLTKVSGYPAGAVPWLLVLFGIGLMVGNALAGRLVDRSPDATLAGSLVGLLAVQILLGTVAGHPVVAALSLGLMGMFGFAAAPGYQQKVMRHARAAGAIASGAPIAAVNLGNALGSWLGGVLITAGFGYTSPIWMGAVATGLALVLLAVAARPAFRQGDD
ncbi:MFS transporter [Streptomyces dubilierae]|uniref:MFS transporter n=1 Tax=Streptomyces dubilierae TaxID=3075533 RepID=A0ABU2P5X0_9ACTN|nr:MFS transporter [Streptomyces sp. DSM 41921]MDT0386175.1 MFS transporter [Streptomyces sp. DSM 41921]